MALHRLVVTLMLALGLAFAPPFAGTLSVRAAGECSDFVADVTIPDGQFVSPGQTFEKVWRLRNCGDTAWDGFEAVRVDGTFGPDTFPVPFTPPGATVDLAVTMTAPTYIGEHWASYYLRTPNGLLGAGAVLVDVADCSLPDVPALGRAGAAVHGTRLTVSALGPGWCPVRGDSESRWIIERYANVESEMPLRALLWTSVWPDEAAASQALLGLPKGWVISETADSIQGDDSNAELGDDGRRLEWTLTGSMMQGVSYAYRVGRTVGWIEVSGHADLTETLDPLALQLADRHIARLHDVSPLPGERPSAERLRDALVASPFNRSLLPEGITPSRVRDMDPAPSSRRDSADEVHPGMPASPIGMAELLVTNRRDAASPLAEILYVVYPTNEDALASFRSAGASGYIHAPSSIGHLSMCTTGSCVVLDGPVLILVTGAPDGIDTPVWGVLDPQDFTTITVARAATAHLDHVLDSLPQE